MAVRVQVERGSPKSCFLFLGEVLCGVNWVSVLSDHFQPAPARAPSAYPALDPQGDPHTMLVYLLHMLVFLTKEEPLLKQPVSPPPLPPPRRPASPCPPHHRFLMFCLHVCVCVSPMAPVALQIIL